MVRGTEAKEYVQNKIAEAFGDKYLGIVDKKLYVLAPEDGEEIQIAIALTAPKNPVSLDSAQTAAKPHSSAGIDFAQTPVASSTEITPEERERVNKLMKKLNL